ncbi:MAG: DUF4129 domain-containing protein [Actinomycetota bacterium]
MALVRRLVAAAGWRRLGVAAALATWVVVVASASGPQPGPGQWLGFGRLPEILWVTYAVVCLTVFLVILLGGGGRTQLQEQPLRRGRMWSYLIVALLLALFLLAPRSLEPEESQPAPEVAEEEEEAPTPSPDPVDSGPGWGQAAALGAVAATAAAVLLWSSIRSRSSAADGADTDDDDDTLLPDAATEARRRLLDTTDPRMAVLAAYAHLEDALAAGGRGREPAETPTEHMARASAAAAIEGRALRRLALLYEHARFSGHEITEADRRAAEADLDQLLAEVGAAPEVHHG